MNREPRIGELFAGYGGLGLATQAVYGGEVVWVSEFEEAPSRILAERLPHAPNLGDITKIDWTAVPPVDILTGGFPCQDVSAAGRRLGMTEGTRSGLWYEMVRAIDALRPEMVVIENVRGLFSAKAYSYLGPDGKSVDVRAIDAVLGTLCDLGYDAQWTTLRASEVGAPHQRDRVFITAHSDRFGSGGWDGQPVLLRPEGDHAPDLGAGHRPASPGRSPGVKLLPTPVAQFSGNTPENHLRKKPGRKVVTDLAILVENGLLPSGGKLLPTPVSTEWKGAKRSASRKGGESLTDTLLLPTPRASDGAHGGPNQRGSKGDLALPAAVRPHNYPEVEAPDLLPTPTSSLGSSGTIRRSGACGDELLLGGLAQYGHLEPFGPYAPALARWERITGRLAPEATEPGRGGRPRLAAPFVEWMMGLPEGWVTEAPGVDRRAQLKALGNGVVPQQAAHALRYLADVALL